jgi:hypothetical protein
MVTYGLYGAVMVIILVVLLFGGRVIIDALRQKQVKGTSRTHP